MANSEKRLARPIREFRLAAKSQNSETGAANKGDSEIRFAKNAVSSPSKTRARHTAIHLNHPREYRRGDQPMKPNLPDVLLPRAR